MSHTSDRTPAPLAAAPAPPVIETSGLVIGYAPGGKKRKVLHDAIRLRLYAGELTSLLGLNGAGKSTLLRTLCGFQPSLGGNIRIHGRPLTDYSHRELSRIIGVVLTEKTNAGGLTAEELVSLGRHPYTGFFGRLNATDRRIVAASIDAVGMTRKSAAFISELSDGERQKIMIAKALAQQCPIIILDEPTAFLDVASRIETMSLLHRLAAEQGKAILLSTHDLELAIQMSDCLWLQEQGRPMICGVPEDLILNRSFETFFDKKGVTFDSATGKLTSAGTPSYPIAVEGDFNTAYWVGNALLRNGLRPSSPQESGVRIHCLRPDKIALFLPGRQEITVGSVAGLIAAITTYKSEIRQDKRIIPNCPLGRMQ